MKYNTFERLFSQERMDRYLQACGGDSRKAMTLYRYNLQLSQQIFTIISFFLQESVISISHVLNEYQKIQRLFLWMDVDSRALLYGLDHVQHICNKINELKPI